MSNRLIPVLAVGLLASASASCSGGDVADPPATARAGTTPGSSVAIESSAAGDECPDDTRLTVVTEDGGAPVAMLTSYADIVGTEDQSGTFTFANYEIERDDARFELRPTLEEGQVAIVVAITTAGEITTGLYEPKGTNGAGEPAIHLYTFYDESGRVFGPEPVIEVTEVTRDHVCGVISVDDEVAAEPGTISGEFVAQRIDSGATQIGET